MGKAHRCARKWEQAFSPRHPGLMSLGSVEGLHARGALSSPLGALTHHLPLPGSLLGSWSNPPQPPGCSTCEGAQMGAVKGQGKPQSTEVHPTDSLLAAVAVPSSAESSPDPKLFLTGKHTGTGLNPDVTPKGSGAKRAGVQGSTRARGLASRRLPHLCPLPRHLPAPLSSTTPFILPGEETLQNFLPE